MYELYYYAEGQKVVIEKNADLDYLKARRAQMRTSPLAQFVYLHIN